MINYAPERCDTQFSITFIIVSNIDARHFELVELISRSYNVKLDLFVQRSQNATIEAALRASMQPTRISRIKCKAIQEFTIRPQEPFPQHAR